MSAASKTVKCLDEKVMACEALKECGKCNGDSCPMHTFCLEETDFATIAYEVTEEMWAEFIKAADDAMPDDGDWTAELKKNDPDWE